MIGASSFHEGFSYSRLAFFAWLLFRIASHLSSGETRWCCFFYIPQPQFGHRRVRIYITVCSSKFRGTHSSLHIWSSLPWSRRWSGRPEYTRRFFWYPICLIDLSIHYPLTSTLSRYLLLRSVTISSSLRKNGRCLSSPLLPELVLPVLFLFRCCSDADS